MDLANKVRLRREQLGWTQDELARRMGYASRVSINKIENGRPVSQKIIVRLADALDTTPLWLMGWEGESEAKEIEKNNDIISDAVVRMRTDAEFLSVVECLLSLDSEKIASVKQLVSAFQK